jgi:acyl carrier protein phosphodiesterase
MNYLAHAFLSPGDPLILMGNLWGDLLKPKDYEDLDQAIVRGVRRHKAIDAFTDQHPAVEHMIRILRPYQGKYTPVVADVLMDFILSKKWPEYHPQSIEQFCNKTYQIVGNHLDLLPLRLHPRIQRMLSHQWLESCKNRDRMEQTLLMLSKRASFENSIPGAMVPYDLHQKEMDHLFVDFFEDLQQHLNLQSEG